MSTEISAGLLAKGQHVRLRVTLNPQVVSRKEDSHAEIGAPVVHVCAGHL